MGLTEKLGDKSKPELCNELIYENEKLVLNRIWRWQVDAIYPEGESKVLTVHRYSFNFLEHIISTFATFDGTKVCEYNFEDRHYVHGYSEGLVAVGLDDTGYGYIDKDMNLVIPMKYDRAGDFRGGTAIVEKDGKYFAIDKSGNEYRIYSEHTNSEYASIGRYYDGMCGVSTMNLKHDDLAYDTDYWFAGKWGFINEKGEEVIAPEYIYAFEFEDGLCIACKGEWTNDKKWENSKNPEGYWSEIQLWGIIDKEGNEVVPFIYDEIKHFYRYPMDKCPIKGIFAAHFGGSEDGKWGVIDEHGNWLVKPIFEDISTKSYHDGMFKFSNNSENINGIYDINQDKVILEYDDDINLIFTNNGFVKLTQFDRESGFKAKLVDYEGNNKFDSEYSIILSKDIGYEVFIDNEEGTQFMYLSQMVMKALKPLMEKS